jgi:tetratricopeptide (TPR) repeat protein
MRYSILLAAAFVALASVAAGAANVETHWLDVESRIQYGYFTEDLRALRNLVEPLAAGDPHDPLKSYYAGLLAYRLIEVSVARAPEANGQQAGQQPPPRQGDHGKSGSDKNEARQTLERCIAALGNALQAQRDFADALALQSACLGLLAEQSTWHVPFAAPKSATQLRKALQLEPKNPRVLLLDALDTYQHRKPSEDTPHTCDKFKSTAAMFETERAAVDKVPGWGAAEAYMWLGRCYLDNGDGNAARDALERSLLIAPEFTQARRLLSSITSG